MILPHKRNNRIITSFRRSGKTLLKKLTNLQFNNQEKCSITLRYNIIEVVVLLQHRRQKVNI